MRSKLTDDNFEADADSVKDDSNGDVDVDRYGNGQDYDATTLWSYDD